MFLPRLNGIFSVIKPAGITSAELCNRIRHDLLMELGLRNSNYLDLKIGHGGTLDLDASGVLPIGLGTGCKLLNKLLKSDKHYICHAMLGIETDTICASGLKIQQLPYDHVTADLLEAALQKFRGNILQSPPKFSALKYQGRRLSDMAYAGETIPVEKLQPRPVTVHQLQCTRFELPLVELDVRCGSGFYVRSLCSDLGRALNTCAHVGMLERVQHGPFMKDSSIQAYNWSVDNIVQAIESSKLQMKSSEWLLPSNKDQVKKTQWRSRT